MNGKKIARALYLLVVILFFSYGPVSASPISGDPNFLLPNNATNTPYTFDSLRVVANGYGLSSFYFFDNGDIEGVNRFSTQTGPVFTSTSGSLSQGPPPPNSYTNLYADPSSFEAKAYHHAQTDGSQNFYSYGSSQVWNWYVLEGNPGQVTLTADILIQGQAFANNGAGGNAGTIFVTRLGFLDSPADLTQDYVISLDGAVNWTGFSEVNTVDNVNVLWNIGSDIHDVNFIIRSQPFTVTVGVPFRLSLTSSTQGFAGPGALGEAWSNFYDPRLVTSYDFPSISQLTPDGFAVVVGEGQYSALGDAGYFIAPVPEPATMLLIGSGLIGLVGYGRKKFLKK